MKDKFPFYKQLDRMDCGPTCLRIIAKYYNKSYTREFLAEKANASRSGTTLNGLAEAAESIGFRSIAVNVTYRILSQDVPLPCIAHWRQRHYVVIYKIKDDLVCISDPAFGLIQYKKEEFLKAWLPIGSIYEEEDKGLLLLLEATPAFFENSESKQKEKLGIQFLFPYLRPYQKKFFQLILGLLIGSFIQLIIPFLTQAIVDAGINHNNLSFINIILVAQLVLFISQTSVEVIRSWLLLHITNRVNINLISDFLIKLMRLPISFFDAKNTGDLLQRIQDNNRIQSFFSASTLNILFSFINLLIFGVILAYYHLVIFFVFLITTIIYVVWVVIYQKKRALLDYKRFDQASGNQSSLLQLLNGMQEIKLNGSEKRRRWEWENIQIKLFRLSIQGLSLNQLQNLGGRFFIQLMNIIVTYLSAKAVIQGHITLGMMLSIQYLIGQLNLPITNFILFIQSWQDAKISLERLSEIHLKENEVNTNQELITHLPDQKDICIKNFSFRYGGKTSEFVLDSLNIIIPDSKVTAIVGASGSGKTTLIKLLLKFYKPTLGNIIVGSSNLDNYHSDFWRSKCGVVMQDGFIFSDTIARNITEADPEGNINKSKLKHAADVANISSFIDTLPLGYKTRIGASGMNLSGGQKQRILIARAVYKNPDFLFFDEATSALDANNEMIIIKKLEEVYKGKTVVIVAHRLSTVKNADQIIVLDKGRVVESGNHTSLVNMRGAYYMLIKNQLELGQ